MITINSQAELDKLLNKDGDLIVDDDLTINVDIALLGNIKAWDITARNIMAGDILVGNIIARNIIAWDINAWNIDARDIRARDISYYAVCFAYSTFTCKSVKGRRENSRHFCLDSEIIIKEMMNEKEEKYTACQDCIHAKIEGHIWYQQYCKAKGRDKSFDPLYGRMVEGEYPHIRMFNDGLCTMYEPKQSA